MDGFSYWIFGYQKFAEPIIRKCICIEKGWKDIFSAVRTPSIPELLKSVKERNDWDDEFPLLKRNAKECLGRRKQRMTLDAAFIDEEAAAVIGEFKSWGGYEKFSIRKLYEEVISGKRFPDRLAINKIYYKQSPLNVSKFVIATNLSTQNNREVIWEIGDLVIEVLDIADLLRKHGEAAAEKCGSFKQLEKSVSEVRGYIKTGGLKGIPNTIKVATKSSNKGVSIMDTEHENKDLKVFIDDDESYLLWIMENPLGFVLNSHRKPVRGHIVLHCANCGTIMNPTRGPGNWTTTEYIKICSLDKAELKGWAGNKGRNNLSYCQVCKP